MKRKENHSLANYERLRRPLFYPHHIEACIRAGGAAARALLLLIKILEDEQTPERRKRKRRMKDVGELLKKSRRWANAGRRKLNSNRTEWR